MRRSGLLLRRLKRRTVRRIACRLARFSRLNCVASGADGLRFAYHPVERGTTELLPCWQTGTTFRTREIAAGNLDKSSLYGGWMAGRGPRYCPSIEAEFTEHRERSSHVVFLELEGRDTEEVYVQGTSNSLPECVQRELIRSIEGLGSAQIRRPA